MSAYKGKSVKDKSASRKAAKRAVQELKMLKTMEGSPLEALLSRSEELKQENK